MTQRVTLTGRRQGLQRGQLKRPQPNPVERTGRDGSVQIDSRQVNQQALGLTHVRSAARQGHRCLGPLLGQYRENRSEEHTSELQSLMRISYAVFCLKKKKNEQNTQKPQR